MIPRAAAATRRTPAQLGCQTQHERQDERLFDRHRGADCESLTISYQLSITGAILSCIGTFSRFADVNTSNCAELPQVFLHHPEEEMRNNSVQLLIFYLTRQSWLASRGAPALLLYNLPYTIKPTLG